MQIGDYVRVKVAVIVYHHPAHRGEPIDVQGLEGEITAILGEWRGRPVSPNYPFQVSFGGKFRAHFQAGELESAELASNASTPEVVSEVAAR